MILIIIQDFSFWIRIYVNKQKQTSYKKKRLSLRKYIFFLIHLAKSLIKPRIPQSKHDLHYPPEKDLAPILSTECAAKTLIGACEYKCWSESFLSSYILAHVSSS